MYSYTGELMQDTVKERERARAEMRVQYLQLIVLQRIRLCLCSMAYDFCNHMVLHIRRKDLLTYYFVHKIPSGWNVAEEKRFAFL